MIEQLNYQNYTPSAKILEIEAGAHIARLEQDYGLISRHVPFMPAPTAVAPVAPGTLFI
jgi:hypothetical protein